MNIRPRFARSCVNRVARAGALAALCLLGACGIEPWVKPYERDRLADPIMLFDRDPVSSAYLDHVYEAREGARGATGGSGGGCGCN
jgi:DNA primase